jgi:hypothetical protein
MTYTEALSELDILLGDTDNFTFTVEEKQRAMQEAWRDRFVVTKVSDATNTYSNLTRSYTITGLSTVREVRYNITNQWPETLPSDSYELVGTTTLNIEKDYRYVIPEGATLTVNGNYKPTTTDDITNEQMIEYVLVVAHYSTLKLLGAKKTNRFIKNDTNMNEIIALRNTLALDIKNLRQGLEQSYERA